MILKNKFNKVNTTVDEDIQKLHNDVDRLRWDSTFKGKVLEIWDKRIEDQFKEYSTSDLCEVYSSYQSERFKYDKVLNVLGCAWVCTVGLTIIVVLLTVFTFVFGLQDTYNYTAMESLGIVVGLGYLLIVLLTAYIDKLYPNEMKYSLVGRCLVNRLGSVKSMKIMSMKDQDYFERYLVNYTIDEIKAGREIIDV